MAEQWENRLTCPYCKTIIRKNDLHTDSITRKKVEGKTTVVVVCKLVREYEISPKDIEE